MGESKRFSWQRPTLPGTAVPSTIGADGLNDRVREGTGCTSVAVITKRTLDEPGSLYCKGPCIARAHRGALRQRRGKAKREHAGGCWPGGARSADKAGGGSEEGAKRMTISTGKLSTLPCVHVPPIKLVVYQRSKRSGLGGSFPLRCFQRFSQPDVATQRCSWRNNWHTSGLSTPVLSYWGQVPANLRHPQRIETDLSHDGLNPAHVSL
jgi:hypothetical protein